jgi:hypothetical protein
VRHILLKVASALTTGAFAVAALAFVWMTQIAIGMALNPTGHIGLSNPWMLLLVSGAVAGSLYWLMRIAWAAVDVSEADRRRGTAQEASRRLPE